MTTTTSTDNTGLLDYLAPAFVEVSIGGLPVISRLTPKGTRQLKLLPGKKSGLCSNPQQ